MYPLTPQADLTALIVNQRSMEHNPRGRDYPQEDTNGKISA